MARPTLRSQAASTTLAVAAALLALALGGCFGSNSQQCPGGLVCPAGEQCTADGTACIAGKCGNGVIDPGEDCDDGNIVSGDGCSANCKKEACGNGVLDPGEVCDDGNNVSGDGCSADCKSKETCGNAIVDTAAGEQCDPTTTGADTKACNGKTAGAASCHTATCGDGYANQAAGEACDNGTTDTATCNGDSKAAVAAGAACQKAVCGDGYVNKAAGEVCDDGNTVSGDGCSADCKSGEGCGNGIRDPGEQCDDGNKSDTDDCLTGRTSPADTCKLASCGDGFVDSQAGPLFEQCDPANPDPNAPACNDDCTLARCGDGKINPSIGEQCDNGPTPVGQITPDSRTCNGNSAAATTAGVDCHVAFCGDKYTNTQANEQCDSGGIDSPTCNANCTTAACGDGYVNAAANEQCDPTTTGADTPFCNGKAAGPASCRFAVCGDNYTNTQAGERCDKGSSDTSGCNGDSAAAVAAGAACQLASCGDGYVNTAAQEKCDDGANNGASSCPYGTATCTGCAADCSAEVPLHGSYCGDGTTDTGDGEACDDGNNVTETACPYGEKSCTACNADCSQRLTSTGSNPDLTVSFCGDNQIDQGNGEQCDDGANNGETQCPYSQTGDGTCIACNSICQKVNLTGPYCGDGTVQTADEACDDANQNDCGLCSADCQSDRGSVAVAATGQITTVAQSSFTDGQTFTLSDGVNPNPGSPTVFTFEFDVAGDGVASGNISVDISAASNANDVATAIQDAINGVTALGIDATASTKNVNLVNQKATAFGNQAISTNAPITISGMSGGIGDNCGAGTGCTSDADCFSGSCVQNQCQCTSGSDCISGTCTAKGQCQCSSDSDCLTGSCVQNVCQ